MPGLFPADQKCPVSNCGSFYNSYTLLSHFKLQHAGGIMLDTYDGEMKKLSIPLELHEQNKIFCVGVLCLKGGQDNVSPVERGLCYPNDLPPNEGHLKTSLPVVAFGCCIGNGRHFLLWFAAPTDVRIKISLEFFSDEGVYVCGKIMRTRHLVLQNQNPFEFVHNDDNFIYLSEEQLLHVSHQFTRPLNATVFLTEELLHIL